MSTYLVRIIDGKILEFSNAGHSHIDALTNRPGIYQVLTDPTIPNGAGAKDSSDFRRFGDILANTVRDSTPVERALWDSNDATDELQQQTQRVKDDLVNDPHMRKIIAVIVRLINVHSVTKLSKADVTTAIGELRVND